MKDYKNYIIKNNIKDSVKDPILKDFDTYTEQELIDEIRGCECGIEAASAAIYMGQYVEYNQAENAKYRNRITRAREILREKYNNYKN